MNTSAASVTNHRMHRSSVRPFFCCGSQLSLNSVTEYAPEVETEFTNLSDSEEVLELVSDLNLEGSCSGKNSKSLNGDKTFRRPVAPRRKKSDITQEKSMRKKFWTIKFSGKLQVRKRSRFVNEQELRSPKQGDTQGGTSCICTSYKQIQNDGAGNLVHLSENGAVASCSTPLLHDCDESCSSNNSRCRSLRDLFRSNRHSLNDNESNLSSEFVMTFRQPINFDELYPVEDIDERRIAQRAREMEEGIEVSELWLPGDASPMLETSASCSTQSLYPILGATSSGNGATTTTTTNNNTSLGSSYHIAESCYGDFNFSQLEPKMQTVKQPVYMPYHSQVDFIHCLVPDILHITKCSFYWGVMDRYQAEKLLDNKPEGTFLLRDSAQEEFLFSVSFRRYGRSLHARIEQWNHKFSFDSHDPGVFASDTVCGLIEHYKDPSCCMFFEPMLTSPLHRNFPFSLQHLARAVICDHTTYDGVTMLPLPRSLKEYLMYYHYKQKVRMRRVDNF